MNIKKKNLVLIALSMFIFGVLLSCGIFAAVSKSVSFNLALKLDPQVFFSLSMRIDYDGDGYNGTHPNNSNIKESASYKIFDNVNGGAEPWATVNQNCIVLNQVLAGDILSNLTLSSRFEITVTNLTNNNDEYLHLILNYNNGQEVFKASNGYGAVNMKYGSTAEATNATKTFELIPQTTLLDGYIQVPFKAEIGTLKYVSDITTDANCLLISAPEVFDSGTEFTAKFEAPNFSYPYFKYYVTIGSSSYTYTNQTGVLTFPKSGVTGNIAITANILTEWNDEIKLDANPDAVYSGGNGTSVAFKLSRALDLVQLSVNTNAGYRQEGTYFIMTNDIYLNPETEVANWANWETAPPSNNWTPIDDFYGILDGNGYKLLGLYRYKYPTREVDHDGFMRDNYGTIKNVGLTKGFIKTVNGYIGAFCGYNYGIIDSCYNELPIKTELATNNTYHHCTAGIAGWNQTGGVIANCYNNAPIDGCDFSAGITGVNSNAYVINCYNLGNISAKPSDSTGPAGGVVGWIAGYVINCYNAGNVTTTGTANCGSIAHTTSYTTVIANCYYLEGTHANAVGDWSAGDKATIFAAYATAFNAVLYKKDCQTQHLASTSRTLKNHLNQFAKYYNYSQEPHGIYLKVWTDGENGNPVFGSTYADRTV